MKTITRLAIVLLLGFAMVLSACSSQATVQVASPTQASPTRTLTPTKASTKAPVQLSPPTQDLSALTPTPTEAAAKAIASTGGIDCMGAKSGDTVSMLSQWSGVEEEKLNQILKPLVDACGIVIKSESAQDQSLLETRVKSGTPPDIAFSKVNQLAQFKTSLKSMTDLGVHADHYASYWKDIGTVDGSWLGLPVKVDIKTILWYSPANFKAHGYQLPATSDEFLSLIDKMASDGNIPFSMGFESGDTTGQLGVDVINDLLVMDGGPDLIQLMIKGTFPYNSSEVKQAFMEYGSWAMDAKYTVGGAKGTLLANIHDAIADVFSSPSKAMMLRQPGSTGEAIAAQFPDLKFGTDYDFYLAPAALRSGIHGSSDWMMAFNDSAAVKAVVAYLSSDQGGQMWAQVGFGVTPNGAGTNAYKDEILKKEAQTLANARTFVPDLGEAIPGDFANAERKAVVDFINGADLDTVLSRVTAVQMQALGK